MGQGAEENVHAAAAMGEEVQPLVAIEGPELVFALAGAVGTDLRLVTDVLGAELKRVNYRSVDLRISQLMHALCPDLPDKAPLNQHYDKHMTAGTDIRSELQMGDALAFLTVAAIREEREKITGDPSTPVPRGAYVVRSLKHPDEVDALRSIYGRAFYLISAYSARDQRRDRLAGEVAESNNDMNNAHYVATAEQLIARDAEEGNNKFGQRLRDTFAKADVFVEVTDRSSLTKDLGRFIDLVFNHPFHTPTIHELSMFAAFSASLRSADLSRQVGSAIVDADGSVITTGCNEVPKASGGSYWPSGAVDRRDFQNGFDPSTRIKRSLIQEALGRFRDGDWLHSSKSIRDVEELLDDALGGGETPLLQGVRLMDLLEFGRVVHAEMSAITDASRRGVAIRDATLYCTTFPCHMCARHIVSSGISEVYYIEPYPKSMAGELYPDSISVEGTVGDSRVNFKPFVGISPIRFVDLFSMPRRKDKAGKAVVWRADTAVPRLRRFVLSYLQIEERTSTSFKKRLEASKFGDVARGRSNDGC